MLRCNSTGSHERRGAPQLLEPDRVEGADGFEHFIVGRSHIGENACGPRNGCLAVTSGTSLPACPVWCGEFRLEQRVVLIVVSVTNVVFIGVPIIPCPKVIPMGVDPGGI